MGQHQAKPAEVPPPPLITLPSAPAGSHGRASLTLPSIIYERGTATSFTDTDEPVTTSDDEGLASATDEEELAPATDELESDNEEPALATDTPKEGGTQPKEGGTQPKEGGTDEPPARSSSARTSSTQPSFRALPFPARHSDTRDTADEMSAEEVQDFMSKYRGTTLGHLLPFSPVCQTRPDKPREEILERDAHVRVSTPQQLLEELLEGNKRFRAGAGQQMQLSLAHRQLLTSGQLPKACLLGCADSRVPSELIFDQGPGDIFIARNAGGLCARSTVGGSIEFAVSHLGVRLLIILGHESCSVVSAALKREHPELDDARPPRVRRMLTDMRSEFDVCTEILESASTYADRHRAAVLINVRAQARKALALPALLERVAGGQVLVVCGYYHLHTGEVEIFPIGDESPRSFASRLWLEDPEADLHPREVRAKKFPQRNFVRLAGENSLETDAVPDDVPDSERCSPEEVLAELKAGNVRYWTGKPRKHKLFLKRLASHPHLNLLNAQSELPRAMVVGCADARAPVELIFDQYIGDVFTCRNAGNLFRHTVAASVEYAVFELGVKVVVVMGHEGCGAVKAARAPMVQIAHQPKELREMLLRMASDLEYCRETLDHIHDATARDREQVMCNAAAQVRKILAEEHLRVLVDSGDLLVVAAFYATSSGIVDFIEVDRHWTDLGHGGQPAHDTAHRRSC